MNEKQRIKRLVRFRSTDCIPWQINCTTQLADRLMDDLRLTRNRQGVFSSSVLKYNPLNDFFGNHLAYIRNRGLNSVREVEPGLWRDEWNVLWDRTIDKDIGTPANCVLDSGDLQGLSVPDPDDPERFAHCRPIVEANPSRYILSKFSYSLFERSWSLRGMENLMIDFLQHPSFVDELFRRICEFNLAVMKNLSQFPIDGIYFGDDWGSQRALLMSPDIWRRFIKPHLKVMYDQAHRQGYDVFIHSCGDISAILDDLVEIGLNVFNPFQPEVMHIEQMMKRYSGRLAFYGSLSIQNTLPFGTAENVKDEVDRRLSSARRYGGLIISPSHDMPLDIPLENILVMLETLKNQSPQQTKGRET